MRRRRHLIPVCLLLILALTLPSCYDMGAGDDETAFYDYFSGVFLISSRGRRLCFIHDFNPAMSLEDSEDMEGAVIPDEYAYVAFMVAPGYTLTVEEFAFFFCREGSTAAEEEAETRMVLDFYVTDTLPTKLRLEGEDDFLYLPDSPAGDVGTSSGEHESYRPETDTGGAPVDRAEEVDESIFDREGYAQSVVSVSEEWHSTLLVFDTPQTVSAGEFIVIRIQNNCYSDTTAAAPPTEPLARVRFTFNHLMFRFTSVTVPD